MTDAVLILSTVPTIERGEAIARALVDERLAACVNVLPPMISVYRWKGAIERETECQIVIKTAQDRVPLIKMRVKELHSYELPEFLVLRAADGAVDYLEWIKTGTRPPG